MAEIDKRPKRGHAFVRMRNKGYYIGIDFTQEKDSAIAQRMIDAAMAEYRKCVEEEGKQG